MSLSIEQLKFAREIGATHYRTTSFVYYKSESGVCYFYMYGSVGWRETVIHEDFSTWDCMAPIDFTPLDDYYADKALDIAATGGEVAAANDPVWKQETRSKYHREIKPGVWVDVYDVIAAWAITNPAQQHLAKKALQAGERGHKSYEQDMSDIIASAERAKELQRG